VDGEGEKAREPQQSSSSKRRRRKGKKKGRKGRTSIVHQQVQLVLKVKDLVLLKDRTPRGRAESGELVSAGVEHAVNVVELSFDEERCK
jgi:hypothetical protein